MSDKEANDINGYGLCWECHAAVPNSSLAKVKVESKRHPGVPLTAFVCETCRGDPLQDLVIELEDSADTDTREDRCHKTRYFGGKCSRGVVACDRTHAEERAVPVAIVVKGEDSYSSKVKAAASLLRGKVVAR